MISCMHMEDLIVRYGLAVVFLGAAVEGDVTMILAGVTAHIGLFRLPSAIALGALGGLAGDCFFYALGRRHSGILRTSALYRKAEPAIERFTGRVGELQIGLARFVYGTRMASMLFWGVKGLPFWRFALIDATGCALWAVVLGGLGYSLSSSAELVIGRVKRAEIWLLAGFAVSLALVLAYRRMTLRRLSSVGKPDPVERG